MPQGSDVGGAGLVGRETELASLLRALESCAVVTVTGLPGVGRSALAAAAAARLATRGAAVLTVSLAGVDDPLAVADAVMARLPGQGMSTSLPEAMWEAYGGSPVLLVLEDVDRVQSLATVVEELADGYPQTVALCTGGRPTGVPGEQVVRLAALPVPGDNTPAEHPCLVLFARFANERGVAVDLGGDRQRTDAARVCRLAGGLPKAIEIAAARLAVVPLAVMARGLGERPGAAPALGWTFDLLSEAAQETLAQLSVFEGPFLLDAVAAVVEVRSSAPGPRSTDPAEVLLELVEAHLLELDPVGTGEPRFLVPELVRGFARQRLDEDLGIRVRDRHARYFSSRGKAGLEVVRRDWPDIVAALDHEMDTGRLDDALAAAVAMAPAVQEVPGAAASLEQRITELLEANQHVPAALQARALMWSTHSYPQDAADDMQRFGLWTAQRLAEATRLARESGDGPVLLDALERTIMLLRITLDLATAVSAAHEGLELARRLDHLPALARFQCFVSMAAWSTGDAARAAQLATSAIILGREHGDPFARTAAAQLLLTLPEELRPELDPPLPSLEELLDQCEWLDQPFTGMTVLASLAHESLSRDDASAAAGWIWRLLMVGANRQRTEPTVTLAAVALLLSAALALGERQDAARLREYTRPLEMFVPYSVTQPALPRYRRDTAFLDSSVSDEVRTELAAEVAAMGMDRVNRWAQEVARSLAGHRPPDQVPQPSSEDLMAADLTPREQEVLAALATGRTNREIADLLGMSAKTVMHHSVAIYRKLGVRSRAAATAWAYENGLAPQG